MAIKLKTVGGIDIYVTDEGKFSAKIGRDTITRKDLASVEKACAAQAQGVEVIYQTDYSLQKIKVTSYEKKSHYGQWRDETHTLRESYYTFEPNEAAYQAFQEINRREKKAQDEWRQTMEGFKAERKAVKETLVQLTPERFAQLQAEAKEETGE